MDQQELGLKIGTSFRPMNPDPELWATAIHEAGHAVVAVYYEIPFTGLTIEPNGGGWLHLDREKIEPILNGSSNARYASKLIAMGYAGYIAQLKVCPSASRVSGEIDVEETSVLLWDTTRCERKFDRKTGAFRKPTEAEIESILALRAHRLCLIANRLVRRLFPAIELVAQLLIRKQRLTSDEVEAIAGPMIANLRPTSTRSVSTARV